MAISHSMLSVTGSTYRPSQPKITYSPAFTGTSDQVNIRFTGQPKEPHFSGNESGSVRRMITVSLSAAATAAIAVGAYALTGGGQLGEESCTASGSGIYCQDSGRVGTYNPVTGDGSLFDGSKCNVIEPIAKCDKPTKPSDKSSEK